MFLLSFLSKQISSLLAPYKSFSRYKLSILLGNIIDHYDYAALYGFLAPLLAPSFFPQADPFVSVLYAYAIFSTSLVTVPLGAFLFGRWARFKGPQTPLSFSLFGLGISTLLIGVLPTYDSLGIFAPIFLIFLRLIREITASGETTIANLYILETTPSKDTLPTSSAYEISTILGFLSASFLCGIITLLPTDLPYWRIPFILGGFASGIGIYLRKQQFSIPKQNPFTSYVTPQSTLSFLRKTYKTLLRISLVSGFSYSTYAFPFIFMNTFIPEITSLSYGQMANTGTLFFVIDGILLLLLGYSLRFYNPAILMKKAAWVLAFSIPILFLFIQNASFLYISFTRFWIVFWGIVFLCPLNIWLLRQYIGPEKYLLTGIGSAVGKSLLGKMLPFLCLYIWHTTHSTWAPALYLSLVAIGAGLCVRKHN